MSARRSKSLQFWATVEEWRQIRAATRAAKARSVSAWLRSIALREAGRLDDPLIMARRYIAPALASLREAMK